MFLNLRSTMHVSQIAKDVQRLLIILQRFLYLAVGMPLARNSQTKTRRVKAKPAGLSLGRIIRPLLLGKVRALVWQNPRPLGF